MSSCRALVLRAKICQGCGVEFPCGGSCCWCDEVTVAAHTREALRQQFSDCLCRKCLEAAAAGGGVPTEQFTNLRIDESTN